eukprot:TRINITY_DN72190_c0_g1_i1.p4 TRINITY_DN72190_c0_g1~~TRINITY_DN72190_c0_g1_i1.p4  ORF type:complete len:104 (-),score=17.69 TRINITY_DN72190_c0_g1_i1:156-467(-)
MQTGRQLGLLHAPLVQVQLALGRYPDWQDMAQDPPVAVGNTQEAATPLVTVGGRVEQLFGWHVGELQFPTVHTQFADAVYPGKHPRVQEEPEAVGRVQDGAVA